MKKCFKFFLLLSLSIPSAFAYEGKFGVGAILGDPTAITIKGFTSNQTAFDAGVAFNSANILLYSDYLRHFPGLIKARSAFISSLSPYVGVGPVVDLNTHGSDHHYALTDDDDADFSLGARVPLGVEWINDKGIPLGVSLEVVPGVAILPKTDIFFQGGVALRYYF